MKQKKEMVFCPTTYHVSLTLAGGRPGGQQLRPVIGAAISRRLARRLELDSPHVRLQKDGHEGEVIVSGRSNDMAVEHHVSLADLKLKSSQRKELGF